MPGNSQLGDLLREPHKDAEAVHRLPGRISFSLINRHRGRWSWRERTVLGVVALAAVTLSVAGLVGLLRHFTPRTQRLQMVTDLVPRRVFLAEQIRDEASRHGLDISLTSRQHGSLEALDEVNSPSEIKLALIPGGVKAHDYPNVRLVATLTTEPLHVLVRPELAAKGFSALRGKRVTLGPPTTASHHVAREVLAFVGLNPSTEAGTGGYTPLATSPEDLLRELHRIDALGGRDREEAIRALPDAAVFLAPTPSVLARQFVATAGYTLLPISFAEAFLLEHLNPPNSAGIRVDRSLLSTTAIAPFTYGGIKVPSTNGTAACCVTTYGTRPWGGRRVP